MMTLDEIARTTRTDRSSTALHDYMRTYEEFLAPLRDQPIVLLEMGVLSGDGLETWLNYFTHPHSEIIGLDIEPWRCKEFNTSRVSLYGGSQSDTALLDRICDEFGPLDVAICDSGHFATQQIIAFEHLLPKLKPGGLYFCEDLHTYASVQHSDGPENIMQYLTRLATEMQGRGPNACGRVDPWDKWGLIDTITFRKGLCVVRTVRR